jgi:hypothetical protein
MSESLETALPLFLINRRPEAPGVETLGELLEGDSLYAPADVSPTPVAPIPRRVATLTNSPGCAPARNARPGSPKTERETFRRLSSSPSRSWALPAPATWGRTRRASSEHPTSQRGTGSGRALRPERKKGAPCAQRSGSDWALPF